MITTAGVALIAALAALVLIGAVAHRARRARGHADDRVADALAIMGERMDALAIELRSSLERVAGDSERASAVLELGNLVALDEILARAVEAAATIPGVDAAMARAEAPDGHAIVVAFGLPTELAERQTMPEAPASQRLRSVRLAYRYHGLNTAEGTITEGLAVPLDAGDHTVGFLAVYAHADALGSDDVRRALETIATAAGPAVERAHRHHASRGGATDTLTGLGNRRAFHDLLAREVARSHRYRQQLSLLVVDLDDFGALNHDVGQFAADEVLRAVADRVRTAAGEIDIPFRVGGDEFAVILPDAPRIEAESLFATVQATLLREPPDAAPSVTLSGGIAVLEPDDDSVSLYERAEAALRRAKAAGKGTAA